MNIELKLLPYQRKLLSSKEAFTFAVMGRGSGKSYTLSVIALLTLLQGKNAILCAQRYDSLKDVLFREIKARVAEWGIGDRIQFKENPVRASFNGCTLYGGSYDAIDALRGLTDISSLILDEVALAPITVLDVLAPCLRGPNVVSPRVIGATTPNAKSQWNFRFAEAYKYGWEIIQATTYDNKFLTAEQIRVIEQAIPSEAMRAQELRAEIVTSNSSAAIITIDKFPKVPGLTADDRVIGGFDAAQGVDRDASSLFVRKGTKVLYMEKFYDRSHEDMVRIIRDVHKQFHMSQLNMDIAFSDYEYNTLKYELPCTQYQFGSSPSEDNKSLYANLRAEMYANLAWQIEHGLCVDGFDLSAELKRQLCFTTWERTPQGRLILVKKDLLRELLGMSPDIADAAALTCLERWDDDPVITNPIERDRVTIRRYANMMG